MSPDTATRCFEIRTDRGCPEIQLQVVIRYSCNRVSRDTSTSVPRYSYKVCPKLQLQGFLWYSYRVSRDKSARVPRYRYRVSQVTATGFPLIQRQGVPRYSYRVFQDTGYLEKGCPELQLQGFPRYRYRVSRDTSTGGPEIQLQDVPRYSYRVSRDTLHGVPSYSYRVSRVTAKGNLNLLKFLLTPNGLPLPVWWSNKRWICSPSYSCYTY